MNISPGLIGTYWALIALTTTAAWSATATLTKRAARRAARR